jgi:hypothetical protein
MAKAAISTGIEGLTRHPAGLDLQPYVARRRRHRKTTPGLQFLLNGLPSEKAVYVTVDERPSDLDLRRPRSAVTQPISSKKPGGLTPPLFQRPRRRR